MSFKVGDKVKVLNVPDLTLVQTIYMGCVGVVETNNTNVPRVRFKNGAKIPIHKDKLQLVESAKENNLSNKLKVTSLSYDVIFNSGKFIVGCQTIDYDDAQKIADFIKKQKQVTYRIGDRIGFNDNEYLIVSFLHNAINLVNLESGHRWAPSPKHVGDIHNITVQEINAIACHDYWKLVHKCGG